MSGIRRRYRRAGAAVALSVTLGLGGVACTDETPPGSPASSPAESSTATPGASPAASSASASPTTAAVHSADLRGQSRLGTVRSRLPARIGYPPDSSKPLLDDLPGQAVVQTVTWVPYTDAAAWTDRTTYFYGTDGRWRSFEMGELDLPASRATSPDTGWQGTLSPDGKRWVFPTAKSQTPNGPVGVMDLSTGKVDYYWPDRGKRIDLNPVWLTPRLLAFDWHGKGNRVRAVVDVESGRVQRSNPAFGAASVNLAGAPDGTAVRIRPGQNPKAGDAVLVRYDSALQPQDETELPFAVRRDEWEPIAVGEDSIAIATNRAGIAGDRKQPGIIVVDAETLQPRAVLQGQGLKQRWQQMAWIDENTLLLPSGVHDGQRGNQPVLAWQVDQGTVGRLSRLRVPDDPDAALVGQIVARAVR